MEYNSIIVRYSEIHLKGKNRGYFEKVLKTNILSKIKKFGAVLNSTSGRYIISGFNTEYLNEIIELVTKTAGVHSVSPAYETPATEEEITSCVKNIMQDKACSFRVSVTRADKTFPISSMEFAKKLGGKILASNHTLTVDLFNAEINLVVDIRPNGKAYILYEDYKGVNGMPVSSSGRGLLLLSGGIDSPVAGYMMIKRGLKIAGVHFESYPYTSIEAKEKALELAKVLSVYNGPTTVYTVNISKIQEAIHENCHADYMITLVRRFMLRISEIIATKNNYGTLITGESLAQVASQTIESMTVIGESMRTNLPLLKPLVGFDKEETIALSKKIGSFDISIRPFEDCCTVFLPDSPVIKPKLEKVLKEEARLNVDALIEEALKTIEKYVVE